MLEFFRNIVSVGVIDVYTAVVATAGVLFWFLDRRSMKTALRAAKDHEMTTLRLQKQTSEANAERSFALLRSKCRATRNSWDKHFRGSIPMLGGPFETPREIEQIYSIEKAGKTLLDNLIKSAPESHCDQIAKIEAYIRAADHTSIRIEHLVTQLEEPQVFHH
ncbi:MAG: hypothetical protein GYB25_12320 [Rhodobacteraceae bacterium]|nr:hypothetical protein [Paracoccaceae bacterium]